MQQHLQSLFPRLVFLLFVLCAVMVGGFIAGVCFHDPDTCWIMATGKWIVEHGRLPSDDPFSYLRNTDLGQARQYLPYQWLCQSIFYIVYSISGFWGQAANYPQDVLVKIADIQYIDPGLIGVLLLLCLLLLSSFLVLPVVLLRRAGMSPVSACCLSMLVVFGSGSRFLARPEAFSYLGLMLLFILLDNFWQLQQDSSDKNNLFSYMFGAFVLVALWCNLHSGFVTGLVYLLFVLIGFIADYFCNRKIETAQFKLNRLKGFLLIFFAAGLGSLISPFGFGLWRYLPELFFMNVNSTIVENQPLTATSLLLKPTYYPLTILMILSLITFARTISSKNVADKLAPALVFLLSWLSSCAMIFSHSRLVPFAILLLVGSTALLWRVQHKQEVSNNSAWQKLSFDMPGNLLVSLAVLIFGSAGALLMALWIMPPMLPQQSIAFRPPYKAITYLAKVKELGGKDAEFLKTNLFNDPQYGDVLIWQKPGLAKVFIDTRFDLYGSKYVGDYQTMLHAETGWRSLLQQYKIGWIFLPKKAPLSIELLKDGAWRIDYEDDYCVVLSLDSLRLSSR